MGGQGELFVLQDSNSHTCEAVKYMNFTPEIMAPLNVLPFTHAFPINTSENCKHLEGFSLRHTTDFASRRANMDTGKFDALVIASHLDIMAVFDLVEPLLLPSRPLVIFSPSSTLLLELFLRLRSDRNYLLVNLATTWFRPYQVLPGRTHPMMRVSGNGGAMLTATKITSGDLIPSTMSSNDYRRSSTLKSRKRPREEDDS